MKPLEKVKWIASVSVDPKVSDIGVRVANYLAHCMNGQTGQCNPSRITIAEALSKSESTVKRALRNLSESGWITKNGGGSGAKDKISYSLNKGVKSEPLKEEGRGSELNPTEENKGVKSEPIRGSNLNDKGVKSDLSPTPPNKEEPVNEEVKEEVNIPAVAKKTAPTALKKTPEAKPKSPAVETWLAYGEAYKARYHVYPIRNQTTNSQMLNFVKRIGAKEAPMVASYYVESNDSWFVRKAHAVGDLLANAEKLRMEWATGRQITQTQANQADKSQGNVSAAQDARQLLQNRRSAHG